MVAKLGSTIDPVNLGILIVAILFLLRPISVAIYRRYRSHRLAPTQADRAETANTNHTDTSNTVVPEPFTPITVTQGNPEPDPHGAIEPIENLA